VSGARRLFLLRHGAVEPETPWRYLGQRDLPLCLAGRGQAALWRETLSTVDFSFACTSDLTRCQATAQAVLAGRALTARPLPALREIDLGQWDGLTRQEVRERHPGQYEARGVRIADYRTPGGESFRDVAGRAVAGLAPILDTAQGDVLAVSHAGTIRALVCALVGLPLERLFHLGQGACCLSILERGGDGWVLTALNLPPGSGLP